MSRAHTTNRMLEDTRFIPALTLFCALGVAGTSIYALVKGPATRQLTKTPEAVVSIGAAVIDDDLYIYGGHIGRAHQHSKDNLSKGFYRLNLRKTDGWKKLGDVRPLQGLAMVAHGGKLYRIGGLDAKNPKDKPGDLWSSDEVTCYDPNKEKWTTCTPLPEPRSSHDAVVVGDHVYIAGGWKLAGAGVEGTWHTTAYRADLSKESLKWEALPELPFRIRANALAATNNQLVLIGGIKPTGKTSNDVAIYDIESMKWFDGPDYPGEKPMRAFGSSAFAADGRIFASAWDGKVFMLDNDAKAWVPYADLTEGRIFHRLVADGDNALLFIAGASKQGPTTTVERLDLQRQPTAE